MSLDTQKLDTHQRQQIMSSVQQQIAIQNAQELLQVSPILTSAHPSVLAFQKLSDKCFKACIQKPGGTLSSSDQVRSPVDGVP